MYQKYFCFLYLNKKDERLSDGRDELYKVATKAVY
jgi:hypothetical protein